MRCGGCTLCCELLAIPELKKPVNTVCEHCLPEGGCAIWPNHPGSCKRFRCLWFANPKWPELLRPDKCGAFLEPIIGEKTVIVNVDHSRPDVWTYGIVSKLIEKYLFDRYAVIVIIGSEKHILLPEGITQQKVMEGIKRQAKRMGLVA